MAGCLDVDALVEGIHHVAGAVAVSADDDVPDVAAEAVPAVVGGGRPADGTEGGTCSVWGSLSWGLGDPMADLDRVVPYDGGGLIGGLC